MWKLLQIESRVWNILRERDVLFFGFSVSLIRVCGFFPGASNREAARRGVTKTSAITRRVIIGQIFIFYYFVGIEQHALRSGFRDSVSLLIRGCYLPSYVFIEVIENYRWFLSTTRFFRTRKNSLWKKLFITA